MRQRYVIAALLALAAPCLGQTLQRGQFDTQSAVGPFGGGALGGVGGGAGVQGPAGPQGATGPAGPMGPIGPTGAAGAAGAQGPSGVGISGASLDSSGRLVLQRTDGSSLPPVVLPASGTGGTATPVTTGTVATGALPGLPTGAVFLLDPESGITLDSAGAVASATSAVGSYTFAPTGTAHAAISATGLAGHPAFATTGIYDGLTNSTPALMTAMFGAAGQPTTICSAFNLASYETSGDFDALWNYNPGGNGRYAWSRIASNGTGPQLTYDISDTSYIDLRAQQIGFNEIHVGCWMHDGSTINVAIDGQPLLSTDAAGQQGNMPPGSGANFEIGNHFPGLVGTTVGYSRALSGADYTQLLAAYAARYGTPHPTQTGIVVDSQGDFLTTVNIPKAGGNGVPLPLNANIALPAGLSYEAGAKQVFGAIFGTATPNANITTTQQVYDTFYTTTMEGNLDAAIGSPMDTGQPNNNTFNAVLRTYPPSSPNNLHVVGPDGLHLRAACSVNHTNCGPGAIYGAGVILSQLGLHPGMTVHYVRKSPAGNLSWAPSWLFSVTQGIPPTGSTLNSTAARALNHSCGGTTPTLTGACQESDIDDGFSRFGSGTTTGLQVNHGYPDIYGGLWEKNKYPHLTYAANGNSYVTHLGAGPDYEELPYNQATAFHDTIFDWRPDGSMNLIEDGKLVISGYQDFTKSTSYLDSNGVLQYVGMQLMLMNQAVPSFAPGHATAVENDGLGVDGWAPVYQSLEIVNGNLANPQSLLASTANAYAGNTGNPPFPAGITFGIVANSGKTFFKADGTTVDSFAASVTYTYNGTTNPDGNSIQLLGLSTSSTTPPTCSGPEEGALTCYGTTKYYNNGSGSWINFRNPNPLLPALPAGSFYIWVQTADGVDHLASTTPYVH